MRVLKPAWPFPSTGPCVAAWQTQRCEASPSLRVLGRQTSSGPFCLSFCKVVQDNRLHQGPVSPCCWEQLEHRPALERTPPIPLCSGLTQAVSSGPPSPAPTSREEDTEAQREEVTGVRSLGKVPTARLGQAEAGTHCW